jgi:glycosyltransferase involved in cell wall biosynthesis
MTLRRPLRVLFLSFYTGLGGGETSLLSLLGALDRRRYAPTLLCPREGRLTEAARRLDVEVLVEPYRGASTWFVPALWARLPATARIGARVREREIALVHSDYHTLAYAVPACRALRVPVLFSCLGWWFRPKPWQRAFFRQGPRLILAWSDAIRRGFLGPRHWFPEERIRVLHPGVDTRVFRPAPAEREGVRRDLGLAPAAPLVTLLARFQSVKGHDVFVESARRVAQEAPAARFVVAGEDAFGVRADRAFERRVRARVAGDPVLRERLRFLGWTAHPERLLAASDVVVVSSRFESFGMVPIEAMAAEVPVVSTNVGGPAETIVDGQTGYLVPPGRPDAIAAPVLALLRDPELRVRLGRAARIRVEACYTLDRYATEFGHALDGLAAGRA